jgi:hypothetical protein
LLEVLKVHQVQQLEQLVLAAVLSVRGEKHYGLKQAVAFAFGKDWHTLSIVAPERWMIKQPSDAATHGAKWVLGYAWSTASACSCGKRQFVLAVAFCVVFLIELLILLKCFWVKG